MLRATPLRHLSRPRTAAVVAATVLALTVTACHSGGSQARAETPVKGGTLHVILSNQPISYLDPQEISIATDANVSRLLSRTLTMTDAKGNLLPDLATDTGRPNADNTVWEFTLKQGVKWQDGSPVTCQDVQYGVERRYAATINQYGGLSYPMDYLKDNDPPYQGPYVATAGSLDSIVCVDTRTVQFHLQRAVADFGYTVSVNTFAPVKKGSDANRAPSDPNAFSYAPLSDGPYQVDPSATKLEAFPDGLEKSITHLELARNPDWDPGTDPVRKAYPDRIVFDYNDQRAKVINDLINSTGDNQYAINLDADVTPNFVQQVINDPLLSKRAVAGDTGATRYFSINMRAMPKLACRQALEYGFDKRSWRFVLGGPSFGELATSMIPPSLSSHEDFDLYETNTQQDGDVKTATQLWNANNCGSSITVAYPNVVPYPQLVSTVVTAYQRVGIQVITHPLDAETYYTSGQISNPDNGWDLILAGWVPDWPSGSAVIPPLFSSAQVTAALTGSKQAIDANENYSELADPAVDKLIAQAFAEKDLTTQYHLWGEADKAVMTDAAVIPLLYMTGLRMEGTQVRGAVMNPTFGEPDLAAIGLAG